MISLPGKSMLLPALLIGGVVACVPHLRAGDGQPTAVATKGNAQSTTPKLPEKISFNAHIRPIMSNTCFTCHGPDEEDNTSGLRLDSFEGATESAIVAGDASASDVYLRITDADNSMPPADFRHQLSGYDKALFRKWIEQGAVYQQHWSYAPIVRPEVPEIKLSTQREEALPAGWQAIDRFVQARLALERLSPAPVADRRSLLRRLSLDLTGLPPTPDEVNEFVADESAEAWQKQVDRLIASKHYGERMATQWLDIVRFTDTVGYHGDQNQNNFAYRDYVIDSLNANKPFDQFTIEQLAGDLLPNPTEEQLIATGLVRLNMMTREGGAQAGEYLAKYTADRVRMLGTAWLGSTTGCCECHNHKYDPFTAEDFYSLGAYFDDLRQWGVYTSYQYTPNPDLKGFNNHSPFPPEIRSKSRSLTEQISFLETELESATAAVAMGKKDFDYSKSQKWFESLGRNQPGWTTLVPEKVKTNIDDAKVALAQDQCVLPTGPSPKDQTITVTLAPPATTNGRANDRTNEPIRTLRLEVIPDAATGGNVGRAGDGRFRVSLTAEIVRAKSIDDAPLSKTETPGDELKSDGEVKPEAIEIAFTQADREAPPKYVSGRPPLFVGDVWQSGPSRWQLPKNEATLPHTAHYHLKQPLQWAAGDSLVLQIKSNDIGKFRVSASPLVGFTVDSQLHTDAFARAAGVLKADSAPTTAQKNAILSAWYWATTPTDRVSKKLIPLRDAIVASRSGLAMTTIAQTIPDDKIKPARVLGRGDWQDESGPQVVPATPHFLPGYIAQNSAEKDSPTRQTRLDLARWLMDRKNPLVARHFVNRTWKHFFGRGLSNKLDDLGNQGEWPSHPQLLDWLAAEFQTDWDIKRLTRLIVNSHTYRQAAAVRSDLHSIDPYNRLLSQQSARRLEAEAVRDNALSIAGLLTTDFIGGPSIFPYQPAGYYSNIQFPNRKYSADQNVLQYRRGVYMHWQRAFLHPMLLNFDAPSRDECVADRIQSNSPQQALTLLNDPTFVEAARAMATRVLKKSRDEPFEDGLDYAFQLAVSRTPSAAETEGLKTFYSDQFAHYEQNPEEANQLGANGILKIENHGPQDDLIRHAAWTQICRVILNLHETITRF